MLILGSKYKVSKSNVQNSITQTLDTMKELTIIYIYILTCTDQMVHRQSQAHLNQT